jgi:homoserine kinase type II
MACATPVAGAPGGPAVTDATAATPEELREAALHFLPAESVDGATFERSTGGVNNRCATMTTAAGAQYLIRIYNNGLNHARVAYEHAVLQALRPKRFTFRVPQPLPALSDGATMVQLASGTDACIFEFIPGTGASLKAARGIGRATAELVAGMADVHVPGFDRAKLPNPLYRNPYDAHHAMSKERFLAQMRDACFDGCRDAAEFLIAETLKMEALMDRVAAMEPPLPEQQIHGACACGRDEGGGAGMMRWIC